MKQSLLGACFLVGAIAFSRDAAAQALTRLESFYGSSQPLALCASANERRVYVADGATVSILDCSALPTTTLPTIAQVPVNASISRMLPDLAPNPILYIAGGTFGLLKMETTETSPCDPCLIGKLGGCFPVTVLDDDDPATPQPNDNEKLCLDVQIMNGQYLVAAFGARAANELRVYDLPTLRSATGPVAPVSRAMIPAAANATYSGPAHALVVRGDRVYVAAGAQGLIMVSFANLSAPAVRQGPHFSPAGNPFSGQPGDVRDVVIEMGWLFAAVDGLGIAQINLRHPWSPNMPVNLRGLSDSLGAPYYAFRLSAVAIGATDFVLGVAANSFPAMASESLPYTPWGAMAFDATPGNLPVAAVAGAAASLLEFSGNQFTGVSPTGFVAVPTAQWQTLQLRGGSGVTRAYELHTGDVVIRDVTHLNVEIGKRGQALLQGKNPPRIGFNILKPRLLVTSADYYPLTGPFLGTCAPDCIDTLPSSGLDTNFGVITNFDAQWLNPATPGSSWMLYGRQGGGWWLQMFQPGNFCNGTLPAWVQWKLESAPDQYGLVGRLAFEGHVDDAWSADLVLCTRVGTRDGLVAYSRSQLAQVALANMPASGITEGPPLSCGGVPSICPVFTADTHPEFAGWTQPGCGIAPCAAVKAHFSSKVFNLDCDTFQLFDAASGTNKWVSATACGYHSRDPNDPFLSAGTMVDGAFYKHCMLVLHDLSTNPQAPRVLAKLYGATSPGNATDVKSVSVNGSRYVVASDFAGHVQVFDVTGAFASPGGIITPVNVWTLPLNPYDGLYDNASEVEIDQYGQGANTHTTAYVACYRRGVEVLDLTNLPAITRIATLDTPGIAEGVKIRRIGAVKELLVACRSGGVQIFGP